MTALALFEEFTNAPLAWHQGHFISAPEFIADTLHCAAGLPDRSHVLNRCEDRYLFLVGLAAAMLRKQITVCPPALTAPFISYLKNSFPGVYCLGDTPSSDGLEKIIVARCFVRHEDAIAPHIDSEQTVLIAFTSGSTGTPSQHPKTWGTIVQGVRRQSAALGARSDNAIGVVATIPPQHLYGLESSIVMPLQMGWMVHGGKPFFPHDIQTALSQAKARNILVTTPLHLRACVDSRLGLPNLEFILSATAPLSETLAAQAEQLFNTQVWEIYGCTEAGTIASRRSVDGPLWLLHNGLSITADTQHCYVHGAHTAAATPLNDIITIHDARHFTLDGRLHDLVNIAGKRASLHDLNQTLNSIDGVIDGVFFMPQGSDDTITRLMAFVVAPGRTALEILDVLRGRIDPVFLPRPLSLVGVLPRNETGKLPLEWLHDMARSSTPGERAGCDPAI